MKNCPHDQVYTRLGISKICEGIGVFAIVDIENGSYIFPMDKLGKMVEVKQAEVEILPDNIKKLYHDFCPLNNGIYECPENFGLMFSSYYLNNSDDNNADIDDNYEFVANRDIKAGEEITAKYSNYSEIPPDETV